MCVFVCVRVRVRDRTYVFQPVMSYVLDVGNVSCGCRGDTFGPGRFRLAGLLTHGPPVEGFNSTIYSTTSLVRRLVHGTLHQFYAHVFARKHFMGEKLRSRSDTSKR